MVYFRRLSPFMTTFLTVREAAHRTGKSPSSIRRILYPILEGENHPDREYVQPGAEEAMQLRIKGESFAWRVSEDLLARVIPAETRETHAGMRSTGGAGDGELIAMLRTELDVKNRQINSHGELISKQMELISGLSERLREGNILIGSLQQRLALTEDRDAKPVESLKAKNVPPVRSERVNVVPTPKTEKGTVPVPKPVKPKRGFFSRLFR